MKTKKSTAKKPAEKKNATNIKGKQTKKSETKAGVNKHGQQATPKSGTKPTNSELVTVEIRIHNDAKGGHPHVKVDTIGENNVSVGLTHDKKKGKKHNNIPLQHNPLGGTKQAYMRKQGTVDKKANYGKKVTGKMAVADSKKAQEIGAKAKQKYLDGQKKKS